MLKKTSHASSRPSPGGAESSVSPRPPTQSSTSVPSEPLPAAAVGLSTSCGVCVCVCVHRGLVAACLWLMLFRDPGLTASSSLLPAAPPLPAVLFPEASPFCHSEVCVGLGGSLPRPGTWEGLHQSPPRPLLAPLHSCKGLAPYPPLSSGCARARGGRLWAPSCEPALPSGGRHPCPALPSWTPTVGLPGRRAGSQARLALCPGNVPLILSAITPGLRKPPLLGPPCFQDRFIALPVGPQTPTLERGPPPL